MRFHRVFPATLLVVVAATLAFQLLVCPIVGLADNGDFRRTIGRFGYGPAEQNLTWNYVDRYYVPDRGFRAQPYETLTSEYLFVAPVIGLSRVLNLQSVSIIAFGIVHAVAFLSVLTRLYWVVGKIRSRYLIWVTYACVLTDVGYAAYLNSLYSEASSCIFFLWVTAESIELTVGETLNIGTIVRWNTSVLLLLFAKVQNAPLGIAFAVFSISLLGRARNPRERFCLLVTASSIVSAALFIVVSIPRAAERDVSYNMLFMALLPESRRPVEDLASMGLDPSLVSYIGTGAYTSDSGLRNSSVARQLASKVNSKEIIYFYVLRPRRLWRHITALLPRVLSLRPESCGNFEPDSGRARGAGSTTFAFWSGAHESVSSVLARAILISLGSFPFIALILRRHLLAESRRWVDLATLLAFCAITVFLTGAFGDANEPIKHQFLFNLILDTSAVFICATSASWLLKWVVLRKRCFSEKAGRDRSISLTDQTEEVVHQP